MVYRIITLALDAVLESGLNSIRIGRLLLFRTVKQPLSRAKIHHLWIPNSMLNINVLSLNT